VSLLLSDIYPLRSASALGNFSADVLLPEVFGDLSDSPSPLVRLSDTEFLAADHPARVVNVQVDGQDVQGWAASTATDASGRAWCKVTMAAPVDVGMVVTAGIIGRASPLTGSTIAHPADVMGYILAQAGKAWDWSNLKAELPGVALAGRIDQSRTIRAWLDEISRSCGVVWSAGGACIYPAAPGVSLASLDRYNADIEDCTATAADAADKLTLRFAWHSGKSGYARSMSFAASPSPFETTGAPEAIIEAPWLRSATDAEALGRRLLSRLARPRVSVIATTGESLRAVSWATLDHPLAPVDGELPMFVLASESEIGDQIYRITGEVAWGDDPEISMTGYAKMIPDAQSASIEVAYKNGIATFTITDLAGKPLQNASVSLDGSAPKKTNAQGQVSFPSAHGKHTIYVLSAGNLPFEMDFDL
jgi:hypothetical protein